MIQRTFDIFNEAEFSWILSSLKDARLYGSQGRVFMQLCFSRFTSVEAQKILDYIHSELPHIQVVGMSLYGDALVHLNTTKMLRVNISEFSESEVRIFEYDAHEMNEDEICSKFRAQLASILDAKGVMVLASGLTFNISRFMENVTQGYEEIPFFGTQANLNTADTEFLKPFVATTRLISAGIVVTVFSGANLYFHVKSVFGWKPIGMPLAVETSEVPCGIGDTLITRIAGKPAADIYRQYLNVRPDRYFISNICEFPLALERNGMIMARVPCGVTKNGELNAMGNIKNGETVRFTYGKTDEILRQSWEASAEMAQFYPQGMFLYVCANRAIFMKDRAHEEIEYFGKIVPGTVYCHGFSELFRYKGQGGVFNSTLIAVGVREGEAHVDSPDISRLPQGLFKSPEWNEAHTTAKEANTEAAENSCDSFSPDSVERHSMFESPIGVSIPIADRLVTFLEAVTEELRNATVAANAASDAKSAFLSSMSHEIRSPINAVLGLDEMILRESTEPQIKGYARDIQSSGRSLLSIINDILDFSKIEAGKMEIINDDYDLRSVITDLANMVERRAVSKGLEFIVNVDSQMPHLLHGDETRIKQCALNILTNAVKYTPTGSVTLTVGCIKKSDDVIDLSFSVKDTGIGIKEADLEKLYKPFERIEENRNRSIEGTGLGMSIVNGLLAEMGSHLVVKSTYGKGSEFSFTIEQRVCSWERIGTHEEAKAALMRAAGTYSESFQAPDARILVVDDTPVNLTVVRGLLKNTRIQIDTAQSGAEALVLVRKTEYNIMFIDHLMPGMNGIEFLAANFTDSESINKNTPAIALTANAVSGAKELYIQAGFDNYLSKPIDSKKFEEMIVSYLPKELVLLPGDKNFVQHTSGGWNGVERRAASGADRCSARCLVLTVPPRSKIAAPWMYWFRQSAIFMKQ